MKLHKYKNYNEYIECQKKANKSKSANIWAIEENIKFLTEYLEPRNPKKGLCHGTRGGHEQKWFMKYLNNCSVIGTEIGNASAQFTVKWDFNKVNPGWEGGTFDFIYSNSFDHAFNPENTLNIWSSQVKAGGLIILEYDKRNEHTGEISMPANKTDPVSITMKELIKFIVKWSDRMSVIAVLNMPVVTQVWRKSLIIEVK